MCDPIIAYIVYVIIVRSLRQALCRESHNTKTSDMRFDYCWGSGLFSEFTLT